MIQRKSTFFIGIFILLVSSSFLALPSAWKTSLLFLSGLALIILSVKFTLPKKPVKRPITPKKSKGNTLDSVVPPSEVTSLPIESTSETKL